MRIDFQRFLTTGLPCAILLLYLSFGFSNWLDAQNQPHLTSKPPSSASWRGQPKYKPDEILVRFRPGVTAAKMNSLHATVHARRVKSWSSVPGLQLVRLSSGTEAKEALPAYQRSPDVLYAEPNYLVHALATPNDPLFQQLWGLQNTGQLGGTPGADIHAAQAWSITAGSSNVVVAVIDTGMDYTHADLAANAWASSSPFSVPINGAPVSCPSGTHGFNALAASCDPMDDNGHGTHVSGTIGAVGNNGVGVAGVNWSVQILPCKFLNSSGGGTVDGAVTCLDFVKSIKDAGAHIVATNNSWGGPIFSQSLSDAIEAQQRDGILFIAAAGNDSTDNDVDPIYPAGFFLSNIVSAAATTRFDFMADFSNFGLHSVSLGAPGQEILSTLPNNSYGLMNGTSMATPYVTGVAALLAAQDPTRDWRAIKNLLLAGGDSLPPAAPTISGRRLDAYGSMTCSNSFVARRLQPTLDTLVGTAGTPITLAALNINCAQPGGPVTVTVSPGGQTITLLDDGAAPDQAAQDGIYTGQWSPPGIGNYQLAFSTGDMVQVTVLNNYVGGEIGYTYQAITGTSLDLGDDDVATINLPFSVQYGGAGFSTVYVSSNGTISFTNPFDDFLNFSIPVNFFENLNPQNSPPPGLLQPVVTLVAPLWMDLYPVKGTSQNVFWAITGAATNRQLIVEWRNVRSFACRNDANANVTFEVIFSENTSNVVFNYANTTFGDACANQDNGQVSSIGVQVSQSVGVQWGGFAVSEYPGGQYGIDQPTVAGGMAIQWTPVDPNAPPNPAPTVSSVSPSALPAGSADTWVTFTGSGFAPNSQAFLYPISARVTEYASSTQIQALLTAADLAYPGSLQINITNPAPGGGTSQAAYVNVTAQNPVITSISPSSVPAASFGFNLTINGSGFVPGATEVLFNGDEGQTTFVSSTQLNFAVPGWRVQTAGTVNVQVRVGPSTFSNIVPFTITPATTAATLEAPVSSRMNRAIPKPTAIPLPGRFLGWKAAQALGLGPEYFARYARPLARLAPREPGINQTSTPLATTGTPPPPASFNFRPTLPAGFIPTAILSGDFNGDGKLDWAVANGGDNSIWIYLGNGDGTAQLPKIVRLQGFAPVALAAADMNGDGKLDLVVAEADSLAVAVLLGNGDGTFGPELTFTTPAFPESLAVADFNGDGKMDVVVGMASTPDTGQLAFLPGDGTGKLGTPITHYGQIQDAAFTTFAIAAADLNRDGLPDIVALDFSISISGTLIIGQMGNAGAHAYLNQGDGIFKMAQQFFNDTSVDQGPQDGQAVMAVALGDVNGDGCIDAVTLDSLGTATFFPGLCDGTFDTTNTRIFGSGIVATAAALADINGDGKLDLISSSLAYGTDAFFASTPSSAVSVQFGDGVGNFGSPTLYRGDPDMVSLAVADLKNNGRPEVITAHQQTDAVTVFDNDGTGAFGAPKGGYVGYLANGQMHAVGNAPVSNFAVLDLNGDGFPDLATLETGSQYPLPTQMTVMLNNGSGTFGSSVRTPIANDPNDISDFVFADFRNTGKKDLLFVGPGSGATQLTFGFAAGNGDGTFQKPALTSLPMTVYVPLHLNVGDFNNDGKLDFLIVGSGGYVTFLGNGDGTFAQGITVNFLSNPTLSTDIRGAFVADVNGDGKADLLMLGSQLLSSTEHFAIYELLGNGDGTFQAPRLLFNNLGPFAVTDLNKDGHPDIVAAVDQGTNAAVFGHLWVYQVFLGNGDGSFTSGETYGPFPNPYADFYYAEYLFGPGNQPLGALQPMMGDYNGDGIPDLVVYSTAGSNVFSSIGYAGAPLNTQVLVLTGNGDGTFSVPNLGQGLGGLLVPQTSADINGDGRTDLLEMNAYTSAYTYLTATNGAGFVVGLVSDPVIGPNGKLRIILTYASSAATTLQLSASDPNITIPTSVTMPPGTSYQDVGFQIGAGFNANQIFALTAQLGTEAHTAYGTQALAGQNTGFIAALQLERIPVIVAGQTTPDYGLLVGSVGGYATQITISCQGLPAGASCQILPNPASLPAGGEIAVSVTVLTQAGLAPAPYPFTVNLTDGVISTNLPASFNVGDFAMSLTPAAQTLGPTDFTSFTLNLQGINGYSQPVQITCSGLPAGTVCPFNTPVFMGSNYFQIHTQNAAAGTYVFTLTGISSAITRTASAQLTVTSVLFTGSVSPTSATISIGSSDSFTVQVHSSGGFQGQVNLACNAETGLTCQLTPNQVTLTSGGSATASLTINVATKPAATPWNSPGILGMGHERQRQQLILLLFVVLLAFWPRAARRGPDSVEGRKPAWCYRAVFLMLALLALEISSCGGGSGGGGGTGGGGTITSVSVQGTAGGTTVTLGSVSVTVP